MKFSVISVGSEFLEGRDPSGTRALLKKLSSMGLDPERCFIAPDDIVQLSSVISDTLAECEYLFIIGGMGSTPDDITREAVSSALSLERNLSRPAMENVASYFAKLGKEVPAHAEKQAYIPRGSQVLRNDKGSAPGLSLSLQDSMIYILPGPPEEVEYIFVKHIEPLFRDKYEKKLRKRKVLHFAQICESELAEHLSDIIDLEKHMEENDIDFAFTHNNGLTDLQIKVTGADELLLDELLHKVSSEVIKRLEEYYFGSDGTKPAEALARLMLKKRLTLSVAESCTGGLISDMLTDVPGSSMFFKYGAVVYSTRSKKEILDIPDEILDSSGAVSEETSRALAENVRKKASSDYAVAITGYAGPDEHEETGKAYVSLAGPAGTEAQSLHYYGNRRLLKERFAATAIFLLMKFISMS